MKNRKMTLGIITYVLVFSVGFFGGFRYLAEVFNSHLNIFRINKWLNGKQAVYVLVFIYSIIILYPFWSDGLKNLKRIDINEIASVLLVVAILGVVVMAGFDSMETSSNTYKTANNIKLSQAAIFMIVSPVIEELYCRCALIFLLKNCLNAGNIICIFISALVFSLFHYKNLIGGNLSYIICYLLIYFILGTGCSYLYLKTDNIISPVILHIIWNVCTIGGSLMINLFYAIGKGM